MNQPVDGYWCEVAACFPDGRREWFLGGYRAETPRLAVRWLRSQAVRLANSLDPLPGVGPFPPQALRETSPSNPNPGNIFRKWSQDFTAQEKQMGNLAAGKPFSILAGGPDRVFGLFDLDIYYALSVRPLVRDFVTDWRITEMEYAAA
ncbi:hypothetical protein PV569_15470 [Streptomyces scabiei]|uniref:hypothetical protein n=1 Tax=Streptomyces scabiei TaxID=1930 RepID=UPI0029BF1200|nr:hypothetical protein [Streptomyces scabiei]MDX3295106.1 hypothetical protein [Streptomyces scabiei]